MIRIWITQVLDFLINLLWTKESEIKFDLNKNVFLKDGWVIGLYKYRNKEIKATIWQLKFRANKNIAVLFGQKMAREIESLGLEKYILVPIPIHWRRRMERGFNQTEWLCKEIARANKNLKYINILKRSVYSQKQSWNKKQDRQKNIKSVFKVKKKFQNYVFGKSFLLIDDVVTTGATLNEARKELEKFSPDSVKALTVAY
jgi:competence protein ComFC